MQTVSDLHHVAAIYRQCRLFLIVLLHHKMIGKVLSAYMYVSLQQQIGPADCCYHLVTSQDAARSRLHAYASRFIGSVDCL